MRRVLAVIEGVRLPEWLAVLVLGLLEAGCFVLVWMIVRGDFR